MSLLVVLLYAIRGRENPASRGDLEIQVIAILSSMREFLRQHPVLEEDLECPYNPRPLALFSSALLPSRVDMAVSQVHFYAE